MSKLLNLRVIENIKLASSKRGPEFLELLVSNFLEHSYELIDKINLSFKNKEPKKFNNYIHQLKGTAASFGAEQLAQLCIEIEATEDSKVEPLVKKLFDCHNEIQTQIKQAFIS
ncbi:Hpt domain-containing protein [Thiotrichales bacterium HSG1]|nr:Hpt domain-containing protein [Thiotrichales bacterium HSG1]